MALDLVGYIDKTWNSSNLYIKDNEQYTIMMMIVSFSVISFISDLIIP